MLDESDKQFLTLAMENASLKAMQDHREKDHRPLEEQMALSDNALAASIGRVKGKMAWLWGAMAGIALAATVVGWVIETSIEARQTAIEARALHEHHP